MSINQAIDARKEEMVSQLCRLIAMPSLEEAPQPGKHRQKRQRVLSARHADGDGIARLDHMIIVHTPADAAQHILHIRFSIFSKFTI